MRLLLLAAALAPLAAAADPVDDAIAARRGYYSMLGMAIGPLGAMAKGEIAYDAAAAQGHADDLAALASYRAGLLFISGSSLDDRKGATRAQPDIWLDLPDFAARHAAFAEAAVGLKAAAGQGREALAPAVGKVGAACKACHDDYRAKDF